MLQGKEVINETIIYISSIPKISNIEDKVVSKSGRLLWSVTVENHGNRILFLNY